MMPRKSARKSPPKRKSSSRPGKRAKVKPAPKRAAADVKAAQGALPQWTTAQIAEAFRRFRAANPEPKGELQHINPFTLLVAVVLSAQATDAGVNKATPALFALADTPEKMTALGETQVRDLIKTIGLFRNKAKNVVALSHKLIAEHGGQVPRSREALEALPGVGRKTANVVLNIAFGEPTIAVDTHIFRVGNRTGLATGKTPLEVEMKLEQVVPENTNGMRTIGLFCTGVTPVSHVRRCARNASFLTCANGRARRSYKVLRDRVRMEGSRIARTKNSRLDTGEILRRGGLPASLPAHGPMCCHG